MDQKKIGEFIAKLRREKNLTQEDLASILNVNSKTVSRWENGNNMPDYSILNSLCNEFDINVLELLNGEKKKSDNKVFEEYMKYKNKVNKRKKILYFIILMLIILLSALSIYFISNFKNVTVYELTGESDHFYYDSGVLLKSNIKYVMQYGKLSIKNESGIEEKDIVNRILAYKKESDYIGLTSFKNDALIKENYGYSEIFNLSNMEYIPNELYIIVFYKSGDEVKHEELKINAIEIMKNDKLINLRNKFISEKNNQEKINFNLYNDMNDYKQFLLDNGFSSNLKASKQKGSMLEKELGKSKYLQLSYISKYCYYSYSDENIWMHVIYNYSTGIPIVQFGIHKKNTDSYDYLSYNFDTNKISGETEVFDEFPYVKDLIDEFVTEFNKYRMEVME